MQTKYHPALLFFTLYQLYQAEEKILHFSYMRLKVQGQELINLVTIIKKTYLEV